MRGCEDGGEGRVDGSKGAPRGPVFALDDGEKSQMHSENWLCILELRYVLLRLMLPESGQL